MLPLFICSMFHLLTHFRLPFYDLKSIPRILCGRQENTLDRILFYYRAPYTHTWPHTPSENLAQLTLSITWHDLGSVEKTHAVQRCKYYLLHHHACFMTRSKTLNFVIACLSICILLWTNGQISCQFIDSYTLYYLAVSSAAYKICYMNTCNKF